MIDLRSDTLTLPSTEMLKTILNAQLGDDGRINAEGRGEDLTVNALEDLSAKLTGKDGGILFSSGTLANTTAILSCCKPGDKVLVDKIQHIYKSEKIVFQTQFGQLIPVFYNLSKKGTPDIKHIERLIKEDKDIKLLCIENTHNFFGGSCIPLEELKKLYTLAKSHNIHVHMDGARLFNAVVSLKVDAAEICQYVDSVMFCLSKGLGSPLGSLLCGDQKFLETSRKNRKLLGGNMRQAGVIAAPGIYALENNIEHLKLDNENAKYVANSLKDLKKIKVQDDVQTNIVMLDVSKSGVSPKQYCKLAKDKGLLIRPVLENKVRLVFYSEINHEDAKKVIKIIRDIEKSL